jgi:hypothetical protein
MAEEITPHEIAMIMVTAKIIRENVDLNPLWIREQHKLALEQINALTPKKPAKVGRLLGD